MRIQLMLLLGLWLGACDHKGGADAEPDLDTSDAVVAADGDAAAVDAADAVTETDASPADVVVPCSNAEIAKCDDHNPCTEDMCNAGTCTHNAATSNCDDGDPCTMEDVCASGACKGKAKDCDDKSPCTIDNCQLDGTCTHVHNQHEDCLPLIQVDQPPRALRLKSDVASIQVSGKLVAQNSQPKSLTVQGKDVAFTNDGAFSTNVPLQFGAQTLLLEVTDVYGGKRKQVQGLHWSPTWSDGAAPIDAGHAQLLGFVDGFVVDGLQTALANAQMAVPLAFSPTNVTVDLAWQVASLPSTGGTPRVALTVLPQPSVVSLSMASTATTDPGTPLHASCVAPLADFGFLDTFFGVQWTVTQDAFNAALRAAWLGGQLIGDVSPIGKDLVPGVTVAGQIHADLPWLLQDCPGSGATLRLAELRLDIQAYIGDTTEMLANGTAHIAIEASPVYTLENGVVQLRLGQTQSIVLDMATGSKDMQATDVHVAIEKALHDTSIPALLKEWAKVPLAQFALPQIAVFGGQPVMWQFQATLDVLNGLLRATGVEAMP